MTVSRRARIGLRVVALGYLALLLLIPVGLVLYRTFEPGLGAVWDSVTTPAAIHAFWLTITITAIAVPLNTIFGILMALALVRGRFRGKAIVEALIDLPFAISPVVVGLDGYQSRYPAQLSGGQRQRMALARALAVEPEVLLLDEPFGALDARVRAELRAWLRRLHDEVHVTTVLVTHDQEEAMEVADRIVVLNHGRIEQDGPPRELYERPANPFVMGFLGPVSRLGDTLVRPHDLRVHAEPSEGALEAQVARVVHLGFEVRVELELDGGEPLSVQLTRDEAAELELRAGDIVWVRRPGLGEASAQTLAA